MRELSISEPSAVLEGVDLATIGGVDLVEVLDPAEAGKVA